MRTLIEYSIAREREREREREKIEREHIVIVGSLTFANYNDQSSPVARNATHAAWSKSKMAER